MRDAFFGGLYFMQHRFPVCRKRFVGIPGRKIGITIARVPVHGKLESRAYAIHFYILKMDVFNRTATRSGRLDVKAIGCSISFQICGEYVPDASGGLTSKCK